MTDKLKCLLETLTAWLKKFGCGLKKFGIEFKKILLRLLQLIKAHKKESIIVAAAVLAITVVIILACVLLGNGNEIQQDATEIDWGTGLTENIPCFSENADSLEKGETYVAAYYSNVTSEQVASYVAKLKEECVPIDYITENAPDASRN